MENKEITFAKTNFIQGLSDITHFWGLPRQLGALFGTVYLSPVPLTLVEIGVEIDAEPDSLQPHLQTLLRLGMLHQEPYEAGIPLTFYAETDYWKIGTALLQEREKLEFTSALQQVQESMQTIAAAAVATPDGAADFYQERMENLRIFLDMAAQIVSLLLTLDEMRLQALLRFWGKSSPLRAKPPTRPSPDPRQGNAQVEQDK